MQNKQILVSIILVVILVVALFLFIKRDLSNTSSTQNGEIISESEGEVEGELPNPGAPIPDLERELVIPDIYSEEITKNTQEQFKNLVTALKEDPTLRNEWLQLALIWNSIQEYEAAEEIWIYVTLRWPLDSVAYGNLGNLYMDFIQDYEKAEENLVLALERNPQILQYTENLYNLYQHRLDDSERAIELLLELKDTLPDQVYFPLKAAEHYRDTGDTGNARKFFQESKDLATKTEQQNVVDYAEIELAKL